MPYKKQYVPAPLVLTHQGVSIYHVYKEDNFKGRIRSFWYDTVEDSSDELSFDVREIAEALGIPFTMVDENMEDSKQILIKGIESGLIKTREK